MIDGALRLQTREATGCKARWSTGYVKTRSWTQFRGYFESRMQITNKTGINNAFWLTGPFLEIDIVEARYPRSIHVALHDWNRPHRGIGYHFEADAEIASAPHEYALLWLPDRLVFAFEGRATYTIDSTYPRVPADIRFSSAIADFAGPTPADPVGSEMNVYGLRVAPLIS